MAKHRYETFESWMRAVNRWIEERLGLHSADLPDCRYRDWYDAGVQPETAALRAIRNAGGVW